MGNVRMRAEQINYGATNVKAALDDLDPMDLIALSKCMNKIEAWKATVKAEEKTGSTVEYTNALALAALSLSADIEPIQDLHGQDAPYVGGAGKNKLPVSLTELKSDNTTGTWSGNVYTLNGVTFTFVTDNGDNITDIIATGTATANTLLRFGDTTNFASGTYVLNGCPTGGDASSTYCVRAYKDGNTAATDAGSGANITDIGTGSGTFVAILIWNGYDCGDGVHFKPMISTEGGTFAPYSNICPISGHTSVTITDYDSESNTATVTIQLGQTVYGGTVNLVTGAARITHAIADLGDLNWTYGAIDASHPYGYFYTTGISDKKSGQTNFISSAYTVGNGFLDDKCITGNSNSYTIYVIDSAYTDATTFKAAVDGYKICYELATPLELTLTPVAVQMLKGYNQISSDGGGDITVEAYTGAAWGGDES